MKNNNKFRLDVWGFITLMVILLYIVFMIYPMAYLIRQSVYDVETGTFTLQFFQKFFFQKAIILIPCLTALRFRLRQPCCHWFWEHR